MGQSNAALAWEAIQLWIKSDVLVWRMKITDFLGLKRDYRLAYQVEKYHARLLEIKKIATRS